jgi:glycosyltransferase involved in cell wall biosynthesis
MSESQRIDRPRLWWKEMVKARRVKMFAAALVGGPSHRDYLVDLGMPKSMICLGYNAVDNQYYHNQASLWRSHPGSLQGLPTVPFFLSVCRFVREKNLFRLIDAFVRYREQARQSHPWDLVLCGDGPQFRLIQKRIATCGHASGIHCPGFMQAMDLSRWYACASAFVLPSLSEPWGLVANEAASAGLPLLVSERAGAARTLVPDPEGTTGARFNPLDIQEITCKLTWMSLQSESSRKAMAMRAMELVNHWGPERFARGMLDAIALATRSARTSGSRPRKEIEMVQ